MREFNSNTGDASHGDAQSDIMGGAAITVMALLVGMAGLVLILIMLVVNTTSQVQAKEKQVQAQTAQITQLKSVSGLTPDEINTLLSAQQSKEDVQKAEQERDQAKQKQAQAEAQASAANAAAAQAQAAVAAAKAASKEQENVKALKEDVEFYKQLAKKRSQELAQAQARAAEAEQTNPQEVRERLKKTETALAQAEARAAKAEQKAKQQTRSSGNMINAGLRLWKSTSDYGDVFITDSKAVDGFWTKRYSCRTAFEKLPVGDGPYRGHDLGK